MLLNTHFKKQSGSSHELYTPCNTFEWTAAFGHLEILQWLYDLYPEGKKPDIQRSSDGAIYRGHLNVIQWCYQQSQGVVNEKSFLIACNEKQLEIVKWMYQQFSAEKKASILNSNNNYLFHQVAISNLDLDTALWLYQTSSSNEQKKMLADSPNDVFFSMFFSTGNQFLIEHVWDSIEEKLYPQIVKKVFSNPTIPPEHFVWSRPRKLDRSWTINLKKWNKGDEDYDPKIIDELLKEQRILDLDPHGLEHIHMPHRIFLWSKMKEKERVQYASTLNEQWLKQVLQIDSEKVIFKYFKSIIKFANDTNSKICNTNSLANNLFLFAFNSVAKAMIMRRGRFLKRYINFTLRLVKNIIGISSNRDCSGESIQEAIYSRNPEIMTVVIGEFEPDGLWDIEKITKWIKVAKNKYESDDYEEESAFPVFLDIFLSHVMNDPLLIKSLEQERENNTVNNINSYHNKIITTLKYLFWEKSTIILNHTNENLFFWKNLYCYAMFLFFQDAHKKNELVFDEHNKLLFEEFCSHPLPSDDNTLTVLEEVITWMFAYDKRYFTEEINNNNSPKTSTKNEHPLWTQSTFWNLLVTLVPTGDHIQEKISFTLDQKTTDTIKETAAKFLNERKQGPSLGQKHDRSESRDENINDNQKRLKKRGIRSFIGENTVQIGRESNKNSSMTI